MSQRRALHKDWRTWTVLIAALAAISAYVLSLDDSDVPVPPAAPVAAPN